MKYGVMDVAIEYCKKGKIEQWIQLFLRNDGNNIALADGLSKETRLYTEIIDFDIELLENIKSGAPEYLSQSNDIDYFFYRVDSMKNDMERWNPPPLIIEYRSDGTFYVCDGRHRLELYRQIGSTKIPAIIWATGTDDFEKLKEIIK